MNEVTVQLVLNSRFSKTATKFELILPQMFMDTYTNFIHSFEHKIEDIYT